MTTKNIVNIQNNKLDFFVNGTNTFEVTLKGSSAFIVSQDTNVNDNFQIRSAFSSDAQDSSADFLGQISNIDNHSIGNLSNVNISGISDKQVLQWDVSGGQFINVDPDTIGATSFLINAPTTAGENGTDINLALLSDRLTFSGTQYEIDVVYDENATNLTFSLPSTVSLGEDSNFIVENGTFTGMVEATHLQVDGTSRLIGNVTIDGHLTVNGTYTIINSEVKLIEDSIITLGYEEGGGPTIYDIGFRGKYLENENATNSALFFYDISASNFVLMNEYDDADNGDGTTPNDIVDLSSGEYANLVAGGIRLNKSSSRALADVSLYNLSYSTTVSSISSITIAATNIIDCSNITNSTAVLSGILNITAWQDDLNSWAQNISNYSIIHKGSGDITVNFMTVFELNNNFQNFDLSTTLLTVAETNAGTYNIEARVLPLGHQIIAS